MKCCVCNNKIGKWDKYFVSQDLTTMEVSKLCYSCGKN